MHFLCQVSSFFETSYISQDDHFAAMQIDLNAWGWKTFGGCTALKAISSQTIASSNESTSHLSCSHLHQKTAILYHIRANMRKFSKLETGSQQILNLS